MQRKFYLISFLVLFLNTAFSQEPLPYLDDFETDNGQWVEYRLGATTDETYTWEISQGELQHNYPVGGSELTNDWMVSPAFDFSNGGTIASLDHKFSGFGFPFGADTIAIYLVSGSQNPAEAEELILLHLFTDETYTPNANWYTLEDISIPPTEGLSYIAFRYQTVVNWLDAAFDNLEITGAPLTDDVLSENIPLVQVYPIPTRDVLNISASVEITSINLYTQSGALVLQELTLHKNPVIDLSHFQKGLYIAEIIDIRGSTSCAKVLIE